MILSPALFSFRGHDSWTALRGLARLDGMPPRNRSFRGNKAALPSKPCVACGLPMSWRRKWAKNWAAVKYCSKACRHAKAPRG